MFSGISNQFNSLTSGLLSKGAEGENGQAPAEEQPAPQPAAVAVDPTAENNNAEPGQASGGMFSNVTGKVSGWLPSNLPSVSMPTVSMPSMPQVSMPSMPSIPGLRKSTAGEDAAAAGDLAAVPEQAAEAQPVDTKDDDDRSSATGGADSRNVSEKGTPTEEGQPGMVGNVTNKVKAGATSFGSFFSGVVNKAGQGVAKIKESVKDNSLLHDFNKEQEAFIKDQSGKSGDAGVCPWVGHKNEDKIKEEVLNLSGDRRNFVRAPPAGGDFEFNYDTSYPIAVALMSEDPQLEKMRFDLVPKIITEENFWRNYFYRVALIIQAGELGTLGTDDAFGKREDDDVSVSTKDVDSTKVKRTTKTESEFISDKFKATTDKRALGEVPESKTKLGMSDQEKVKRNEESPRLTTTTTDDEWEKDLAAEIQDFEVVDDQNVDESELDDLK